MKPCGVTETGAEAFTDYWTRYILGPQGKRLSMVVMWRNKYVSSESDTHYFSVYPAISPSISGLAICEQICTRKDHPDIY